MMRGVRAARKEALLCVAHACATCRRGSRHTGRSTCQAQRRAAAARRRPPQGPGQCCCGRCPAGQHSLGRAGHSGWAGRDWRASSREQGTDHHQRDLCARPGVERASRPAVTRYAAPGESPRAWTDTTSSTYACSKARRMDAAAQDSSMTEIQICSTAGQSLKSAAALGGAAHSASTGQSTGAGSAQGTGTDLQGTGSVQGAAPLADSTQSPQYTTPAPNPTKTAQGMTSGTQVSSTGKQAFMILIPAKATGRTGLCLARDPEMGDSEAVCCCQIHSGLCVSRNARCHPSLEAMSCLDIDETAASRTSPSQGARPSMTQQSVKHAAVSSLKSTWR